MIEKQNIKQVANCRYCKINKRCTLYKVTTTKGPNKKIVSWGTWVCELCESLREDVLNKNYLEPKTKK